MANPWPELTVAYIGPNAAHLRYRTAIANAKILAFVLAQNDAGVLRSFLAQAEEARKRSPDGTFALGMAGRATRTTIQMAIHITSNEVGLVSAEPGGFVSQALGLAYRETYRVFETYLVDLFEEIALREKRILFSAQVITHEQALGAADPVELLSLVIDHRRSEFTRAGLAAIEKAYTGFGLPIVPMVEPPSLAEQEDVIHRLHLLSAVRNVIEHRRSLVDQAFIDTVPNSPYRLGDRIAIGTPELGDALTAVEWTVAQLNRRAIDKFGLA